MVIVRGSVRSAYNGALEIELPGARVGDSVTIAGAVRATATIRSVGAGVAHAAVHGSMQGIAAGARVERDPAIEYLALGTCALGRALDAWGSPIDGGPLLRGRRVRVGSDAPPPETRTALHRPLWTGVRAIDALLTIGAGARIGVFGGPGCGKSTLLEMLLGGVRADGVVVALVGERGREAQQWIEACGAHMTIVCATSDRPAAERVRAADVAMAQACALRDRGLDIVLLFDSLARFAAAHRELAIANGESVGRGGYPPSVFSRVAGLVENAGAAGAGTITLLATVLNDGEDRDPVSEAARALLDGHIQLSSRLAQAGRFPAIDVLASISRAMAQVVPPWHLADAARLREALGRLDRIEDARLLGAAVCDQATTAAIQAEPAIEALLRQSGGACEPSRTLAMLREVADTLEGRHGYFN